MVQKNKVIRCYLTLSASNNCILKASPLKPCSTQLFVPVCCFWGATVAIAPVLLLFACDLGKDS